MTDKNPLKKLTIGETTYETNFTRKFEQRRPYVAADPKKVVCVIPGVIQKVHVQPHKKVGRNERLLVLEAMKMENDILSPADGRIKAVHVRAGQMVARGELLVELE